MAFTKWLCTHSTRKGLVKIVHPGGHVELHDRPLLAAEIMLRNPRCCITYPHVFKQPWAIVPPEKVLMLGQKFYIVPISTIRKLQKQSLRQSPSHFANSQEGLELINKEEEEKKISACWLFVNQSTPKPSYTALKQEMKTTTEEKDGCAFNDKNCFMCLLAGSKLKPEGLDDSSEEQSSTSELLETKQLNRKRPSRDFNAKKGISGSPKRHLSHGNWTPRLESINEE